MLRIAFHPLYIHPLPEKHRFPMEKYELIYEQLLYVGIVDEMSFFEPKLADRQTLEAVHDSEYVEHLFNLTLDPKMVRRIGFPLSKQLIDRERYIADGTVQSSLFALENGVSFNIAGGTHHAGRNYGDGFCMFNDQAVAAAFLLKNNLAKRVLIIDLDVHQGDGTADIFQDRNDVFTLSIHCQNNYPFQKRSSTWDIGLEDKTGDEEYLRTLEDTLSKAFRDFRPDFVFFQAGVDVLETDKLGKLSLSLDGCRQRDEIVFKTCYIHRVPVQVSMGGGYSTQIRDIVNAHTQTYKTAIQIFNL